MTTLYADPKRTCERGPFKAPSWSTELVFIGVLVNGTGGFAVLRSEIVPLPDDDRGALDAITVLPIP